MKNFNRILSLFLVMTMLLSLMVGCVKPGTGDPTDPPEPTEGPSWRPPADEYTIPMEEGYNQITFYWSHPGSIDDCDLWAWWDGKEGSRYEQ